MEIRAKQTLALKAREEVFRKLKTKASISKADNQKAIAAFKQDMIIEQTEQGTLVHDAVKIYRAYMRTYEKHKWLSNHYPKLLLNGILESIHRVNPDSIPNYKPVYDIMKEAQDTYLKAKRDWMETHGNSGQRPEDRYVRDRYFMAQKELHLIAEKYDYDSSIDWDKND